MRPWIIPLSPRLRDWVIAVAVLALTMTGTGGQVQAGMVINVNQVGSDVVMTGSGTFNLTALTYSYSGGNNAGLQANISDLIMGTTVYTTVDVYTSITGPTSFGPGGYVPSATTGAGPLFGVYQGLGYLEVPQGYSSGTLLSATDTYSGATFSSLGLTPGTYTYTWGTGANADFFRINIGTAAVPEPSSLVLMGIAGITGLGYAWRRRHIPGRRLTAIRFRPSLFAGPRPSLQLMALGHYIIVIKKVFSKGFDVVHGPRPGFRAPRPVVLLAELACILRHRPACKIIGECVCHDVELLCWRGLFLTLTFPPPGLGNSLNLDLLPLIGQEGGGSGCGKPGFTPKPWNLRINHRHDARGRLLRHARGMMEWIGTEVSRPRLWGFWFHSIRSIPPIGEGFIPIADVHREDEARAHRRGEVGDGLGCRGFAATVGPILITPCVGANPTIENRQSIGSLTASRLAIYSKVMALYGLKIRGGKHPCGFESHLRYRPAAGSLPSDDAAEIRVVFDRGAVAFPMDLRPPARATHAFRSSARPEPGSGSGGCPDHPGLGSFVRGTGAEHAEAESSHALR